MRRFIMGFRLCKKCGRKYNDCYDHPVRTNCKKCGKYNGLRFASGEKVARCDRCLSSFVLDFSSRQQPNCPQHNCPELILVLPEMPFKGLKQLRPNERLTHITQIPNSVFLREVFPHLYPEYISNFGLVYPSSFDRIVEFARENKELSFLLDYDKRPIVLIPPTQHIQQQHKHNTTDQKLLKPLYLGNNLLASKKTMDSNNIHICNTIIGTLMSTIKTDTSSIIKISNNRLVGYSKDKIEVWQIDRYGKHNVVKNLSTNIKKYDSSFSVYLRSEFLKNKNLLVILKEVYRKEKLREEEFIESSLEIWNTTTWMHRQCKLSEKINNFSNTPRLDTSSHPEKLFLIGIIKKITTLKALKKIDREAKVERTIETTPNANVKILSNGLIAVGLPGYSSQNRTLSSSSMVINQIKRSNIK